MSKEFISRGQLGERYNAERERGLAEERQLAALGLIRARKVKLSFRSAPDRLTLEEKRRVDEAQEKLQNTESLWL